MFTGPAQDYARAWRDLDKREAWVVAPLIAVIIALGFFPKPVLDVVNPAVARTMLQVQVSDPEPAVPPVAEGTQP
jgi:NADH-quinone oxidoreductase subunit M